MFDSEDLTFTIIKRTIVYSLFVIGIIFLGLKNPRSYILGFIFGTGISILGFKLLDNTIKRAITMEPSKASGYATAHYFIRYFIYFIVIVVAGVADYLSFPAAILGLIMVKIVIITGTIFDTIRKNKKN